MMYLYLVCLDYIAVLRILISRILMIFSDIPVISHEHELLSR